MLVMGQSKRPRLDLTLYEQLWELHAGFVQVRQALARLGENQAFHRRELQRLAAWLEEARAATASYLTGAIEEAETTEAGRLFRSRRAREQKED